MTKVLTEAIYRQMLRDFLGQEILVHRERLVYDPVLVRELVLKMGQVDLFAPCYDQEVDPLSLPLNFCLFRVLIEEVAKLRCFGFALTIAMHVGVFLPLVINLASTTHREALVKASLRGEVLGTIASTEAEAAGSDFLGMATTSVIEEDSITLNGRKHYVTNITLADYVIVFTRWQPGRHFTNHCAILVPIATSGVRCAPIPMGVMQGAVIGHVEFAQVKLDRSHLLGRRGWGFHYFLQHIAVERLSGGIWATVVAEECLREAQQYAQQRLIGTSTLWERGATQHRLAQGVVQVTLLRALVEKAVALAQDQHIVDVFLSATVKAAVPPIMEMIVGFALQLQGARGLEADSLLLSHLHDFRAFGVAGGSTETMLDIIADIWAQGSAVPVDGGLL